MLQAVSKIYHGSYGLQEKYKFSLRCTHAITGIGLEAFTKHL